MLIKEILNHIGLNIYLPDNLLKEDLEDVTPLNYVKKGTQYIINFKDSTLKITIDTTNPDEYYVMTETFENTRNSYVSYDIEGNIICIS